MTAINRLAFLRYIVIDECLVEATRQNETVTDAGGVTAKLMHKQDLLAAVNARIAEFSEHTKPIAMRTLEKDIVDMETMYGLRIERGRVGGKVHLTYAADSDGIHRAHLAQNELHDQAASH